MKAPIVPAGDKMPDFRGAHGNTADEVIPMQLLDAAWHRLEKGDVAYRSRIGMASPKGA